VRREDRRALDGPAGRFTRTAKIRRLSPRHCPRFTSEPASRHQGKDRRCRTRHDALDSQIRQRGDRDLGYPKHLPTHLTVQDTSGDSAIIEFAKGKLVIHHGPEYRVMTNDPPYDEMIELTKQYVPFGGTKPLPGDAESEDRFVRLAAYAPDPKNYTEAVAGALSLLRIAQVPFRDPVRVPDQGFWGAVQTNWVSAVDVTNSIYYVNSATVPSLFWLDLKAANLTRGAPLLYLDLHDPTVGGNALRYLKPWQKRRQRQ
jgi:penicillin V acylase-like amidase (Ntn superfamily)